MNQARTLLCTSHDALHIRSQMRAGKFLSCVVSMHSSLAALFVVFIVCVDDLPHEWMTHDIALCQSEINTFDIF